MFLGAMHFSRKRDVTVARGERRRDDDAAKRVRRSAVMVARKSLYKTTLNLYLKY